MATSETVAEKSTEQRAYDLAEKRRLESLKHESAALALGDDSDSMRHKLAQVLCAGRYVIQDEHGDVTAERRLMAYAASVTKAIGIALLSSRRDTDEHDVDLSADEAAIGLFGIAELLQAAPRLIDSFDAADVNLCSAGSSQNRTADGDAEVLS